MLDDNNFKKIKSIDPFAAREAEKYENPIPSREMILSLLNKLKEPVNFVTLQKHLAISNERDKLALRKRLRAMIRDGQLSKIAKSYCLQDFKKQYDFKVILDENVQSLPLIKIVGNLFEVNGFKYVTPFLNKNIVKDILIPKGHENGAQLGDYVILEVMMPAFDWADPIGKVVQILGKSTNREVLIKAAIHSLNIPNDWGIEVKHQISTISKLLDKDLIADRIDLRDLSFVTIDGEDAKDFDDAVFCQPLKKSGWKLYVAIADVSHYVIENSPIDQQANLRGNSVYFPGKVIPMLPEILANDLCSLKPNVDRLVMVCEIDFCNKGKLVKYKFHEAIICSKARLTYNQVAEFVQTISQKSQHLSLKIADNLTALYQLFIKLNQQRQQRGAIDFETTESKVIFNKKGEPVEIKSFKRNIAHKIIEECMLSANVATAEFLERHKLLSIYRVHEGPKEVKLTDLKAFLSEIGLSLENNEDLTPKDYSKLLHKITNRPDAEVIQMILLRSMCQAVYSTDNIGHFGLAYPAYTHFTSPIRRYTDLLVHRNIKVILHNSDKGLFPVEKLQSIANHCSFTERRADEATKEVIKACKCQYLTKYVGHNFVGIISGVTKFGLFVEIKDFYIDGLLHINSLGKDYFIHDPIQHKLIGERTGKIYTLGMEIKVILSKVDLSKRRLDFALSIDDQIKSKKSKSRFKSKSKSKSKSESKFKTKLKKNI